MNTRYQFFNKEFILLKNLNEYSSKKKNECGSAKVLTFIVKVPNTDYLYFIYLIL